MQRLQIFIMTKEEIAAYNKKHSPKILLRMGWSYYDTESAARIVAQQADKEILRIQEACAEYAAVPSSYNYAKLVKAIKLM